MFVALVAASIAGSFGIAVITFGITFGILVYNGDVRLGSQNHHGRRRRRP